MTPRNVGFRMEIGSQQHEYNRNSSACASAYPAVDVRDDVMDVNVAKVAPSGPALQEARLEARYTHVAILQE